MNVFDFDGTLYNGDSTVDFYLFCIRRHPWLVGTIFQNVVNALRFKTGLMTRKQFKERYFTLFLPHVNAMEEVKCFWDRHRSKLKPCCLDLVSPGDVVASASPTFLLQPICNELDVELIATHVDDKTGELNSANCRGESKLSTFKTRFPNVVPNSFYTDDVIVDAPMVAFAKTSYLVKGHRITLLAANNGD